MNFQALLFCQDEKTARVTTQLLNELEFSVETASEPFAAVKKLMGQHFDAVVVDCDSEQNASLLFKGARNSTLNQSSLAVAVVEGQAGVANAFRIGANLVLTKPINVEQAKGTLRVARGLLKKGGETAKATPAPPSVPAKPAATQAPVTPKSAAPAPPVATRQTAPADAISKPVFTTPPAKSIAAAAFANTNVDAGNVFDVEAGATESAHELFLDSLEEPKPAVKPEMKPASRPAAAESRAAKETPRPPVIPVISSGGAASAPAPAKARALPEFEKIGDPATPTKLHAAAAAPSSTPLEAPGLFSQRQSVPTFGSLDTMDQEGRGGAGKFVLIAVVLVGLAAAAYFGYTKFSQHVSEPPAQPTPDALAPVSSAPSAIVTATAVAPKPSPAAAATSSSHNGSNETTTPASHKPETARAADVEPEVVVTKLEPEPRIVKANPTKPASTAKNNEAEVEAPSALGAAPGDQSEISQIVSSARVSVPTAAPSQMLKVSQGVTQGLLLKRVQPAYPRQALQMRIQGAVQLLAVINKSGSISSVKVISGDPVLARAAVEAVNQWKYKPYTLDGEPVDIQTQVTVNFRLP